MSKTNEFLNSKRYFKRLWKENAQLRERLAVLEKNSSNSSKPPSSDIVKPPKTLKAEGKKKGKGKLKRGAQPGHKPNLRKPLALELIDEIVQIELTACPDCGHKLDLVQSESELRIMNYKLRKQFIIHNS